eukprot:2532445-Prymnesium_polylepis.1
MKGLGPRTILELDHDLFADERLEEGEEEHDLRARTGAGTSLSGCVAACVETPAIAATWPLVSQ